MVPAGTSSAFAWSIVNIPFSFRSFEGGGLSGGGGGGMRPLRSVAMLVRLSTETEQSFSLPSGAQWMIRSANASHIVVVKTEGCASLKLQIGSKSLYDLSGTVHI